jgi:filamin
MKPCVLGGEEVKVLIDTRNAGPGELTACCVGPQKAANCEFFDRRDGTFDLTILPQEIGVHVLQVKYNDEHIPESPFIICVAESFTTTSSPPPEDINNNNLSAGQNPIEINGSGLVEAKINQEVDFVIDGSRAVEFNGLPEIKLTDSNYDIDVKVMQLGHNIYRCSYVPQIPGLYTLTIKMNDKEIGHSPYKVDVQAAYDSTKVTVNAEKIKICVFGQEIKTTIDTRGAGPGELTAHCMGVNKVAFCEFVDHADGTFDLLIKPQEPSKHILQIKYNDEHVPGSPFIIGINSPPDASKVKVYGTGVNHGVLDKFKSSFSCETKGAGSGQLNVKIRGPKGGFRVEMQRENQKERTVLCKYDPAETGEYQIHVKWSGEDVPGSPFNVHLFKNDAELDDFNLYSKLMKN